MPFEEQNMTFTVDMLPTCVYIVMLGPAVIKTVCKYSW